MEPLGMNFFVSHEHDNFTRGPFVRAVRDAIATASRLRYILAHEGTHQALVLTGPNHTGMSSVLDALRLITRAESVAEPLSALSAEMLSARAPLVTDWHTGYGFGPPQELPIRLAFQETALPRVDRAALLRLLDGILTALCRTLILALAALARLPEGITFFLVMLAACLRYGRREEPGDHIFLPKHRIRMSLGSSPQD